MTTMTLGAQLAMNASIGALPAQLPVPSFLADLFELPAPAMENDHAGSLYAATPAPSSAEIRKGIRETADLMIVFDDEEAPASVDWSSFVDDGDVMIII